MEGNAGLAAMLFVLAAMFGLMIGSAWNDSATYDEVSHIGAGFAYITQRDYRINAEAPIPLKAIPALAAELVVRPNLPPDTVALKDGNSSEFGRIFLYESGNDADRIVFWSRMPLMIGGLVFGAMLFLWTRRHFGSHTAFLTLLLFAFSPTVLSHAGLVNSDLGASFGFFAGIAGFLRFLAAPTWANVLVAGLACTSAAFAKFSTVLLAPMLAMLLVVWILTIPTGIQRRREAIDYGVKSIGVLIVAIFLIWTVYGCFVWGSTAPERYSQAYTFPLSPYGPVHAPFGRALVGLDRALIESPFTRPLGEFILGFFLASSRVATGDVAYLFGKTTAQGSWLYFPALYLLKEPLALHALTIPALWLAARRMVAAFRAGGARLGERIHMNFVEFSALAFVAIYWTLAICSGLNIGVRHVMPTFPFIYLLVSRQIARWLESAATASAPERRDLISIRRVAVGLAMIGLVIGTLRAFPYFLPYYNSLAGGSANGWKIAIDSNYDWGQDLRRLSDYVATNHIERISVDYFGRADPQYYLSNKLVTEGVPGDPPHGWYAISASERQMAYAVPARGFASGWEGTYDWLKKYEPVDCVGYSIFVYRLP